MKERIFIFAFLVFLVSCKKELPEILQSKIKSCELAYEYGKENDSVIIHLQNNEIDKLSKDSIQKLIFNADRNRARYAETEKELEEMLKINPEYSNYDEYKAMKKPYYLKDSKKYFETISYLDNKMFESSKIEF